MEGEGISLSCIFRCKSSRLTLVNMVTKSQFAIGINIEGRIAFFVFLSMFRCPCTSETVSAMVLLVTLGTGILIMKG